MVRCRGSLHGIAASMATCDGNFRCEWVRHCASLYALATCFAFFPIQTMAIGCPNGSDHWFNVTIKLDPQSLPPGVTAQSAATFSGSGTYIKNTTRIPLVINPPPYLSNARAIPPPDPKKTYQGAYPRPLILQLVSGEAYYCDGRNPLRCDMSINANRDNSLLDTPEINQAINTGWVVGDERPIGVKMPSVQNFQFLALYGDKRIALKGTVSFSLNNEYDPKMGEESKRLCAQVAHREWYTCQSNRECAVVSGRCGVEWAANANFEEESRKNPPRADMPCTKPLESHPANTVAACQDNKCVLIPPGFYSSGTQLLRQ
jgi:hypothetical protein